MSHIFKSCIYSTKQIRRKKKHFLSDCISPFLVILALTLLFLSSNIVFRQAAVDTTKQIVFDMTVQHQGVLSESDLQNRISLLDSVEGVGHAESVAISVISSGGESPKGFVALEADSDIWQHFTFHDAFDIPDVNQCLVVVNTEAALHYDLNSTIPFSIPYFEKGSSVVPSVSLNLTVSGLVSTDIDLSALFFEYSNAPGMISQTSPASVVLTNFGETIAPILDFISERATSLSPALLCHTAITLDQDLVQQNIVLGSVTNLIDEMKTKLTLALGGNGRYVIGSNLEGKLSSLKQYYDSLLFDLVTSFLPIIFLTLIIARIQGIRTAKRKKREIRLLRTKGYSLGFIRIGQYWHSFVVTLASLVVGLTLGIVGAYSSFSHIDSAALDIAAFSMIVVIAASIPAYTAHVTLHSFAEHSQGLINKITHYEETRNRGIGLPLLCTALGIYKMAAWMARIDPFEMMMAAGGFEDVFVQIVFSTWISIDYILNVIGPLLLMYGLASLSATSERVLYELSGISARLKGTLGILASRNLYRNRERNAHLALILALVVGYATWTSLSLDIMTAHHREFALVENGSDISFQLSVGNNSFELEKVLDLSGVDSLAVEREFSLDAITDRIRIRGIEPQNWTSAAYYRRSWFAFNDSSQGIQSLVSNDTIILERLVAARLGLAIGDFITLSLNDHSWVLHIIGLYGPDPILVESSVGSGAEYLCEETWSYVNTQFCDALEGLIATRDRVLVRVEDSAVKSEVIHSLEMMNLPIYRIQSADDVNTLEMNLSVSLVDFRLISVLFAIPLSLLGIFSLTASVRNNRAEEIRNLQIHGFGRKRISGLLYWEIAPLMIFIMVGVAIGAFTSLGFIRGMSGPVPALVIPVFSFGIFSIIFVPFISVLCAALMRLSCYVTKWRGP